MDTTTLLVIILIVLVLGGGGYRLLGTSPGVGLWFKQSVTSPMIG